MIYRALGWVSSRWRDRLGRFSLGLLIALLWSSAFPLISPAANPHPISPDTPLAPVAVAPPSPLEQGRNLYQSGQYAEAIAIWLEVLQTPALQADPLQQSSLLSNLALAYLKQGEYDTAARTLEQAQALVQPLSIAAAQGVYAQSLSAQAQLLLATSQPTVALTTLDQAIAAYRQADDTAGVLRSYLNQAQILRSLGRYRAAQDLLRQLPTAAPTAPDLTALMAAGLRQEGDLLRLSGDLTEARSQLETALTLAEELDDPALMTQILLSLGDVLDAQRQADPTAVRSSDVQQRYQQAAALAPTPTLRLQAQVSTFSLLVQTQNWGEARSLLAELQPTLAAQPLSASRIYSQIEIAYQLIEAQASLLPEAELLSLLTTAATQARQLQELQAESYALGYLGRWYEQRQQWETAIDLTQSAHRQAQAANADEIAYQWQWQLGRLYEQVGQDTAAIAAYQQAITTLQALRSDLSAVNPEVRFSFREGIEPIYRELVSLLLKSADDTDPSQKNLQEARQVIESLQVAELVNFFRANCVVANEVQIDAVDQKAAVIYPILLPDRLEVVVSIPQQPLVHHRVMVPRSQVESTLRSLRQTVGDPRAPIVTRSISVTPTGESAPDTGTPLTGLRARRQQAILPIATQVYDWLIRPELEVLQAAEVETLVFVLDGALRNVPMAVLYDGEQYLLEQYAIALTPGLQLLESQPLAERDVRVIVGALTEARQDFAALPFVNQEIDAISAEVPYTIFKDETFTSDAFQSAITKSSYPVVHLATHGQFSSNLEDTFILTWDGTINANELSALLQTSELSRDQAIELLILSACETASGDDRAALGLAGIAVRSGARSTVATLWSVSDQGTSLLMSELYRQLNTSDRSKADVLRQAQLSLLRSEEFQHPYFWAPFILIGNWL